MQTVAHRRNAEVSSSVTAVVFDLDNSCEKDVLGARESGWKAVYLDRSSDPEAHQFPRKPIAHNRMNRARGSGYPEISDSSTTRPPSSRLLIPAITSFINSMVSSNGTRHTPVWRYSTNASSCVLNA